MKRHLHPWAVFSGWAAGMIGGTAMAVALDFKGSGVFPIHLFGGIWAMYAAVPDLLLNLVVSFGLSPPLGSRPPSTDQFST